VLEVGEQGGLEAPLRWLSEYLAIGQVERQPGEKHKKVQPHPMPLSGNANIVDEQ